MEKLKELLNEYEEERKDGGKWDILDVEIVEKLRCLVISKSYGFIKWLVENDKIDISKVGKLSNMGFGDKYTREETLLMLLSIQDEPIEFLVSILK